jgi:hypothetical protein
VDSLTSCRPACLPGNAWFLRSGSAACTCMPGHFGIGRRGLPCLGLCLSFSLRVVSGLIDDHPASKQDGRELARVCETPLVLALQDLFSDKGGPPAVASVFQQPQYPAYAAPPPQYTPMVRPLLARFLGLQCRKDAAADLLQSSAIRLFDAWVWWPRWHTVQRIQAGNFLKRPSMGGTAYFQYSSLLKVRSFLILVPMHTVCRTPLPLSWRASLCPSACQVARCLDALNPTIWLFESWPFGVCSPRCPGMLPRPRAATPLTTPPHQDPGAAHR